MQYQLCLKYWVLQFGVELIWLDSVSKVEDFGTYCTSQHFQRGRVSFAWNTGGGVSELSAHLNITWLWLIAKCILQVEALFKIGGPTCNASPHWLFPYQDPILVMPLPSCHVVLCSDREIDLLRFTVYAMYPTKYIFWDFRGRWRGPNRSKLCSWHHFTWWLSLVVAEARVLTLPNLLPIPTHCWLSMSNHFPLTSTFVLKRWS